MSVWLVSFYVCDRLLCMVCSSRRCCTVTTVRYHVSTSSYQSNVWLTERFGKLEFSFFPTSLNAALIFTVIRDRKGMLPPQISIAWQQMTGSTSLIQSVYRNRQGHVFSNQDFVSFCFVLPLFNRLLTLIYLDDSAYLFLWVRTVRQTCRTFLWHCF